MEIGMLEQKAQPKGQLAELGHAVKLLEGVPSIG